MLVVNVGANRLPSKFDSVYDVECPPLNATIEIVNKQQGRVEFSYFVQALCLSFFEKIDLQVRFEKTTSTTKMQ